jgi:uncharacterized protein YceK
MRRPIVLVLVLVALGGCATVRNVFSKPPEGRPTGKAGWLEYRVSELRFEAPEAWSTSGGPQHLSLEAPDGAGRLEVSRAETNFADEKSCLADAEAVLRRGDAMERVRRHPTRLGGIPALTIEGDQGGWHVWAWAACDGGTQYQLFFTARTPATPPVLEAHRALVTTVRVGGET